MYLFSLNNIREYHKLILLVLNFFILVVSTSALQISEIHFDPDGSDTDREWVEVYNDGQNAIDLTEIKFFEANVNHGIEIFNQANSTEKNINAGEHVIIVQDINKFKTDFPAFNGKIFKASFSLSNTGETLALKDKDGNILHSVNYTSADKQTAPTPGLVNSGNVPINYSTTTNQTSTTTNSTSTTTSQSTNTNTNVGSESVNYFYRNYWPESEKIYIKPGENKVVMQGQEIVFDPKVLDGNKKEVKNGLQYKWNFGDGYTSEKREGVHAYKFVGEFVVNLQVNYNGFVDESKMYVKVVEPKVSVKLVTIDSVNVVEIRNENHFELNVGNLELKNAVGTGVGEQNKIYVLPDKLFVLGNKSIYLGPELTGFASSTENVILSLLSGKVLSKYENPPVSQPLAGPLKGAQVRLASIAGTSTVASQEVKAVTNLSRKTVSRKVTLTPVVKPEIKEEIKVAQNSNRIEFKNESDFSFLGRLKKIWGM